MRKHSDTRWPRRSQRYQHVERQRSVYAVRRTSSRRWTDAGLDVDPDMAAGLYLWVSDLANPTDFRGSLVKPPGRAWHPRGPRRLRHGSPRARPHGPDRRRTHSGGQPAASARGLSAPTRQATDEMGPPATHCAWAAPVLFVRKTQFECAASLSSMPTTPARAMASMRPV